MAGWTTWKSGIALVAGLMATAVGACTAPTSPSAATQPPTPATAASQPSPAASPASAGSTVAAKPASPSASPSASPQPAAAPGRWNVDTDTAGSTPAGAQVFSGQWGVRAEADAPSPPNALCQTGQADFPSIGLDNRTYADLTLSAKFKPISGKEDQAGGLIFRVQDKDNYYIARANALEDNLIFFIYQNARRSQLKSAGAKVANGVWHDLRVDVRGNAFVAFLDGSRVVEVTDDRYKTGGIGLWTKSDSVTCFDDVQLVSA